MQNNGSSNTSSNLEAATKRQVGKHIGLLDRVQSFTSLTKGLNLSNSQKNGTTVTTRILNSLGLGDAPILIFFLSIVFVLAVGWILRGCIGASSTDRSTYILFIQQCFTIWLWILVILIVLNFLLNMIFL